MKTRIIVSLISLFAIVSISNAQTAKESETDITTTRQFVDTNSDGICDNFESRPKNGRGMAYSRGNGNGQCFRQGNSNTNRQGYGKNNGKGNNQYCNRGNKRGNGQGSGQGQFVDSNKNGTCDNRE